LFISLLFQDAEFYSLSLPSIP